MYIEFHPKGVRTEILHIEEMKMKIERREEMIEVVVEIKEMI